MFEYAEVRGIELEAIQSISQRVGVVGADNAVQFCINRR